MEEWSYSILPYAEYISDCNEACHNETSSWNQSSMIPPEIRADTAWDTAN